MLKRGLGYLKLVSPLPRVYRRVVAAARRSTSAVASSTSSPAAVMRPEQVMLYCEEDNVFLCVDQVMPKITPNISVDPMDPDGDPLGIYLRSLKDLKRRIPEDALLLPGHNLPFVGIMTRIAELEAHHKMRCEMILQACRQTPHSTAEMVPLLFGPLASTTRTNCRSPSASRWRTPII